MATEDKIRELAYGIWEQEGRPDGKDMEHYLRAKQILEEQELTQASSKAPAAVRAQIAAPSASDKKAGRDRPKRR